MPKNKKFYAVKNGRVPGIYFNSEDSEKQTNNFPNSLIKVFYSLSNAKKFLNDETKTTEDFFLKEKDQILKHYKKFLKNPQNAIAFTDGSYRKKQNSFSYAGVLLIDNQEITFSKKVGNSFSNNCSTKAELAAVRKLIILAYKNKVKNLKIHYDFHGISNYLEGVFKSNNKQAKSYINFIEKYKKEMNITFIKIKSHSGNYYNNLVDRLAYNANFEEKINIIEENF